MTKKYVLYLTGTFCLMLFSLIFYCNSNKKDGITIIKQELCTNLPYDSLTYKQSEIKNGIYDTTFASNYYIKYVVEKDSVFLTWGNSNFKNKDFYGLFDDTDLFNHQSYPEELKDYIGIYFYCGPGCNAFHLYPKNKHEKFRFYEGTYDIDPDHNLIFYFDYPYYYLENIKTKKRKRIVTGSYTNFIYVDDKTKKPITKSHIGEEEHPGAISAEFHQDSLYVFKGTTNDTIVVSVKGIK